MLLSFAPKVPATLRYPMITTLLKPMSRICWYAGGPEPMGSVQNALMATERPMPNWDAVCCEHAYNVSRLWSAMDGSTSRMTPLNAVNGWAALYTPTSCTRAMGKLGLPDVPHPS